MDESPCWEIARAMDEIATADPCLVAVLLAEMLEAAS